MCMLSGFLVTDFGRVMALITPLMLVHSFPPNFISLISGRCISGFSFPLIFCQVMTLMTPIILDG